MLLHLSQINSITKTESGLFHKYTLTISTKTQDLTFDLLQEEEQDKLYNELQKVISQLPSNSNHEEIEK
mgnify:CR=1 FL=1